MILAKRFFITFFCCFSLLASLSTQAATVVDNKGNKYVGQMVNITAKGLIS